MSKVSYFLRQLFRPNSGLPSVNMCYSAESTGIDRERWNSLSGKSFWITGGGTGFGQSIALCLASAGSRVFVSGRRGQKLQETVDTLVRSGLPGSVCIPVIMDLSNPADIENACTVVSRSCPDGLDGLINCAALPERAGPTPLSSATVTYWDSMMAVNLRAPWLVSRSMAAIMAKTGMIRILNMTSTAGWAGTAGVGLYNITKAALNNLTMSLAEELALIYEEAHVQVNAVDPGQARTEMNQGSSENPDSILPLVIKLLTYPNNGPNGKFFHKDGRFLDFGFSTPFEKEL